MPRGMGWKFARARLFVSALALSVSSAPLVAADQEKAKDAPKAEIAAASRKTEAQNMRLVGYHDLQSAQCLSARDSPSGQSLDRLHRPSRRHAGHPETLQPPYKDERRQRHVDRRRDEPKKPTLLHHIPGEAGLGEQGGAQMVRICDGAKLPKGDRSKVYMLRTGGTSSHQIWESPRRSVPRSSRLSSAD